MSTAGKVLSVLVTLALLGWIFLASLVADLNANWGRQLKTLQTQVTEAETKIDANIEQTTVLRHQTATELFDKDQDILVLRTKLSKLEKDEAALKETLSRYEIQKGTVEAGIESAKARVEYRTQERANTAEELSKAQMEVAVLQADTDKLFNRLDELQKQFTQIINSNRSLLERLSAATSPRIRSASLSR
jgi:chromosome segregation ATPase